MSCNTVKKVYASLELKELISFEEFVKSSPHRTIDELMEEYKYKIGKKERRGISFIYTDYTWKIFISLGGCDLTIIGKKGKFETHYPEYAHMKWTLKGMVYYVLAHEIAHILIPLDKGEEIFPLILGSGFAFKNHYIAVPQGKELKDAWECLGIKLTRELDKDPDLLNDRLDRCKNWLESLPFNEEFLKNV